MEMEEKKALDAACDQFRALMDKQLERAKKIKETCKNNNIKSKTNGIQYIN